METTAKTPKTNAEIIFVALGFKSKKLLHEAFSTDMPRSPEDAHDRIAYFTLESRIDSILQQHASHSNDKFFLLDLSNFKRAVGDVWEKKAEQIHTKIHSILEDSLIDNDIYMKRDDITYVVAISNIDTRDAQLKVLLIKDDIINAIIAKETGEDLIVITGAEISWPSSIKFQTVTDKDAIIRNMLAEVDRHRYVAPQEEEGALADSIRFVFRPLLAVRTQVVSAFVCIPIKPNEYGGYFSGYDVIGQEPSTDDIVKLDIRTQEAIHKELLVMKDHNLRSLLALPVNFETLASHHRKEYLTRAHELFKGYKNRIIYELVGVPDHVPASRMFEVTAALKPTSRSILARFPISHGSFESFRSLGLHAVGVDLYNKGIPEKTLFKKLERFIDYANKAQIKAYAHGINTASLYMGAVSAGIDYLDGYALSSIRDQTEDVSMFSYDMLYRKMSGDDGKIS